MDPLDEVALLASLVARLAPLVARSAEAAPQWVGIRGDGLCSTTLSCQLPKCFLHPQRN